MDRVSTEVMALMMNVEQIFGFVFSAPRAQFSMMKSHAFARRAPADFAIPFCPRYNDLSDFFVNPRPRLRKSRLAE